MVSFQIADIYFKKLNLFLKSIEYFNHFTVIIVDLVNKHFVQLMLVLSLILVFQITNHQQRHKDMCAPRRILLLWRSLNNKEAEMQFIHQKFLNCLERFIKIYVQKLHMNVVQNLVAENDLQCPIYVSLLLKFMKLFSLLTLSEHEHAPTARTSESIDAIVLQN